MAKRFSAVLVFVSVLFSCATTRFQFSEISTDKNFADLEALQLEILDLRFEKKPRSFSEKRKKISAALMQMKKQEIVGSNYYAFIFGLEGEIAQIMGDKAGVRSAVASIEKTGGRTDYLTILKSYLEKSPKARMDILGSSNLTPLIRLHLAVVQYEEGLYAAAVSNFDRALVDFPEVYATYYNEMRQQAFHLMENSREGKEVFLGKKLTYKQVLSGLIGSSMIFQSLVGGGKVTEEQALQELVALKITENQIKLQDECKRGDLARILMELFATASEHETFNRRCENYKNRGRSPIGDVDFTHSNFVPIIFAVERKFIELRDGENFFPNEAVGGFEFSDTLKRIESTKLTDRLRQLRRK